MNILKIVKTELTVDPLSVGYSTMTDQEAFDSLSAKTIMVPQDIVTRDIQKYLSLNGLLLPIEASTIQSAVNAVRNMELFDRFTMADVTVNAALTTTLDALVADSLITTQNKTDILAMGDKLISRAEQLGATGLHLGHIIDARNE